MYSLLIWAMSTLSAFHIPDSFYIFKSAFCFAFYHWCVAVGISLTEMQGKRDAKGLLLLACLICWCLSSSWLALSLTVPDVAHMRLLPFCSPARENCVQWHFLRGHFYKYSRMLNEPFSNTGHLVWEGNLNLGRSNGTRNTGEQQYLPLAKCSWKDKIILWK